MKPAISQPIVRRLTLAIDFRMMVTQHDQEAVVYEFVEPPKNIVGPGAEALAALPSGEEYIALSILVIERLQFP